jgi:hypothetical protein
MLDMHHRHVHGVRVRNLHVGDHSYVNDAHAPDLHIHHKHSQHIDIHDVHSHIVHMYETHVHHMQTNYMHVYDAYAHSVPVHAHVCFVYLHGTNGHDTQI